MRIQQLAPEKLTELLGQYLKLCMPETRLRAIGLIKKVLAEYEQ